LVLVRFLVVILRSDFQQGALETSCGWWRCFIIGFWGRLVVIFPRIVSIAPFDFAVAFYWTPLVVSAVSQKC